VLPTRGSGWNDVFPSLRHPKGRKRQHSKLGRRGGGYRVLPTWLSVDSALVVLVSNFRNRTWIPNEADQQHGLEQVVGNVDLPLVDSLPSAIPAWHGLALGRQDGVVLLGKRNRLVIVRDTDIGQILDGGPKFGEILLPERYVDRNLELEPGDEITVFLYKDSEDRPVATTEMPIAEAGDFAALVVQDVSRTGAFLDWGLLKDLLLPRSNWKGDPCVGQTVVVKIGYDKTSERLVATQKLSVDPAAGDPPYQPGEKVEILVASRSDLGWTCVVDEAHLGMLFANEVFRDLREGMTDEAYVREVRSDGKIDLSLEPIGYGKIPALRNKVLEALKNEDGYIPLHDGSSPEAIYARLGCSKKNFKKAVGALYRDGTVRLEKHGISLI